MKVALYSSKDFERPFLENANREKHNLAYIPEALSESTVNLSAGCPVISIFAGDDASTPVLKKLQGNGVQYIAIRAAGYDNVHLEVAGKLGIRVANVPAYSPYAIAEHAICLMLALNRKIVLANQQVRNHNFTVGNLIGFDLNGKTVGIIGTGKIGSVVAKILHGFGCKLLGYDLFNNKRLENDYGLKYLDLNALCSSSDIITIHTCLSKETKHLINEELIINMKHGVMLINTARGAIIDTNAVIPALENGRIVGLGTDVYEHEKGVFFYDCSGQKLNDPLLEKLLAMPNVLVTPHQAFATREALTNIATTTFMNIDCWDKGQHSSNELLAALPH